MMGGSRGDIKRKARPKSLFVPELILPQNLDLCGMPYVPALGERHESLGQKWHRRARLRSFTNKGLFSNRYLLARHQ